MEEDNKTPASPAVEKPKPVSSEEYPCTPIEEIQGVVSNLRKNFEAQKPLSLKWRVQQLKQLFQLFKDHEDEFASALQDYYGHHLDATAVKWIHVWVVFDIIQKLIENLENYMNGKGYHGKKPNDIPQDFPLNFSWHAKLKPVAKGLVLIIAPWNYPLTLLIRPAAAAIAAGNSVVLKPSEITGKVAKLLEDLIPKYMDTSMIRVVNGGPKETTELLKYKFDFILYTGSAFVGKIIMAAASKHLTPVDLELGGKNPALLCDSVGKDPKNFEIALKRIFWGRWLMNTGQICMAPEYIVISKKYVGLCVQILKKLVNEWLINFENNDKRVDKSKVYGRIVNTRHFDRINQVRQFYLEKYPKRILIGTGEDDGDSFEAAIGPENREERYIPPMVVEISLDELAQQSEVCEVMKQEIFGPILTIISCDDAGGSSEWKKRILKVIDNDEVNSKYPIKEPLSCYLFSENEEFINYFEERIAAGSIVANDVIFHFGLKNFPFGGKGGSGMGHYNTNNCFDTFTHFKPCAKTGYRSAFLTNFRYPGGDLEMVKKQIPKEIKEKNTFRQNAIYGVACAGAACAAGYGLYSQYGNQIVNLIQKLKN